MLDQGAQRDGPSEFPLGDTHEPDRIDRSAAVGEEIGVGVDLMRIEDVAPESQRDLHWFIEDFICDVEGLRISSDVQRPPIGFAARCAWKRSMHDAAIRNAVSRQALCRELQDGGRIGVLWPDSFWPDSFWPDLFWPDTQMRDKCVAV